MVQELIVIIIQVVITNVYTKTAPQCGKMIISQKILSAEMNMIVTKKWETQASKFVSLAPIKMVHVTP